MTQRIRDQLPQIVAGFDWARFTSIVDVGGGQGTVLAAILQAHPRMRGHLVDLEPTAVDASRTFTAQGLADRTEVIAGSFFDPLPARADGYLLVDILHDWDDAHAHRILSRCAQAAHPDRRSQHTCRSASGADRWTEVVGDRERNDARDETRCRRGPFSCAFS